MKISVDKNKCNLHGQCVIAAPEIFKLLSPDQLEYRSEVGEDLRSAAEAAVDLCPEQAISLD